MKKSITIAAIAFTLTGLLSSCGGETVDVTRLKKENDSLKNELIANKYKFDTRKSRVFRKGGTTPVPWNTYKNWVKKFQETYYYTDSPVYYSSFLLDKSGLNKFLSSSNVKYLHVLWGQDTGSSNEETMIIRGIGADGTVYYLTSTNTVSSTGTNVLQHCLPCPPCADGTFTLPETEYDFR